VESPSRTTPPSPQVMAHAPGEAARAALPAGTPGWITAELVALTKKVWEPRYGSHLSVEEAVTVLLNVGRLFGVLSRG
jgi:hypothetical protein